MLNGTGAPAQSAGNNGDFYLDTAADVLYGPKAGGSWPAAGTSLTGSPGPAGPPGPQGQPGQNGVNSVTDLNGITCTTAGQANGAVTVNVASDNTVTLTCNGLTTNPNCTHANGEGQNYTDCNDLLGDPQTGTNPYNGSGYTQAMANDAAQAYVTSGQPALGGPFNASTTCAPGYTGSAVYVVTGLIDPNHEQVLLWEYGGAYSGHVRTEIFAFSAGLVCPSSSDPTWN